MSSPPAIDRLVRAVPGVVDVQPPARRGGLGNQLRGRNDGVGLGGTNPAEDIINAGEPTGS